MFLKSVGFLFGGSQGRGVDVQVKARQGIDFAFRIGHKRETVVTGAVPTQPLMRMNTYLMFNVTMPFRVGGACLVACCGCGRGDAI